MPYWLTYGRTVFCQKSRTKSNALDNYRPIFCLPLMCKLLKLLKPFEFLEGEKILPEERKCCKRNVPGTKDQLLLDKTALRDCKRRSTKLAMAWIDYRKAYDLITPSSISERLDLFGVAANTKKFLVNSMNKS